MIEQNIEMLSQKRASTFKFCLNENICRTLAFNTQECLSEFENIFISLRC